MRKNLLWTLLGRIAYIGGQWAILVTIARLEDATAVGKYALGLAVSAPILIFFNLGLRAVQATDSRSEFRTSNYLSIRLATSVIGLLAVICLALAVYPLETSLIVIAVGVTKGVESVADSIYGGFQRYERMDKIAISLTCRAGGSAAGVWLVLTLGGSLMVALGSMALVWLIVLVGYDLPVMARIANAEPSDSLHLHEVLHYGDRLRWRLVRIGLPLGIAGLFVSLNPNIPRYFIETQLGEAALGVFASMAYLVVAVGVVIAALGQVVTPRLAQYATASHLEAFRRLVRRLLLVCVALAVCSTVGSLIVGSRLLLLLYGSNVYAQQSAVLTWLMLVAGLGYGATMLGCAMVALRRLREQPYLLGVSALVALTASLLLIPRFGLEGAAWAWGSALCVQLLGSAWVVRRELETRLASGSAAANV